MTDILGKVAKSKSAKQALAALAASYAGWKVVDGKYNISADLKVLPMLKHLKQALQFIEEPGASLTKLWYQTLAKPGQAKKVMFISADDGRTLTFGEVEELSNRIAHWALSQGLKAGDVVALVMDNCLEYVPFWLGLGKARVISALINTNTKGKPLTHAITTASSKITVFGTEHADAGAAVAADLRAAGVSQILCYDRLNGVGKLDFCDASFDEAIRSQQTSPVDKAIWMAGVASEPAVYIYTSGTTGLPKACKVSHVRMLNYAVLCQLLGVTENDVVYGSGMPLYHTAANLGTTTAIKQGATYIVRAKFSASSHFEDCAKYNATAMQYIGELCRYLLSAPTKDVEKKHKLRIAIGNGLRPEIWDDFQRRFNVPEIGEFYGATEGNAALVNHCKNYEGQGAIGRAGSLFLKARPMHIVKFDVENEVPLRNKQGFCMECGHNEVGELIAPIRKIKTAAGEVDDFEGYTDKSATDKKVARDVFRKGDAYFRTGDLLRRDAKGYYYFVDRIGDTFRWKGENVSTMEVSEVLSGFQGIVDANVYGAAVPGKDGRACMVAITLEAGADIDPNKFATYCRANLPSYSLPVFVRFLPNEVNLTGTFKHQKVEYRNEGCDPSKVKDEMWWFNVVSGTYERYGPAEFAKITSGEAKL